MAAEDWEVGSSRPKGIRAGQRLLTFEGLMRCGQESLSRFHSTIFECWPYQKTRAESLWGEVGDGRAASLREGHIGRTLRRNQLRQETGPQSNARRQE